MTQPFGVFGGTFDPVHFGHLRTALELQEGLGLSEVLLVPAGAPPHRDTPQVAAEYRLAMLHLAVADQRGFVVDDRELRRPGPSFMVDTLTGLRQEAGRVPICLLLGMDAFLGLAGWDRWEQLIELAHIVVAHRPGWHLEVPAGDPVAALLERRHAGPEALAERPAGAVVLRPVTALDISATAIRDAVAAGRSIRYLVPEPVRQFIRDKRLYRGEENARP